MLDDWRRPGFTLPGYAAAAARKNHELKTAHQFTPDTGREAGMKGGRPPRIEDPPKRPEDR